MRQELKEEFEREAEWRRQKAAEYPDDKRNLDAAAGYDRLAATVGAVPDELMVAYTECFNDMTETELHRELLKEVFHAGAPRVGHGVRPSLRQPHQLGCGTEAVKSAHATVNDREARLRRSTASWLPASRRRARQLLHPPPGLQGQRDCRSVRARPHGRGGVDQGAGQAVMPCYCTDLGLRGPARHPEIARNTHSPGFTCVESMLE